MYLSGSFNIEATCLLGNMYPVEPADSWSVYFRDRVFEWNVYSRERVYIRLRAANVYAGELGYVNLSKGTF